jgi:hypothetical protein
MSKKFKQNMCVYCGLRMAESVDHVLSRKLFPISKRANLPAAPACHACNSEKSALETYLCAVLPFVGQQAGALSLLQEFVPSRLEKNRKLQRALAGGLSKAWSWDETIQLFTQQMALPFEGGKLKAYMRMVVRGLLWHHWKITLDSDHGSLTLTLIPGAQKIVRDTLMLNCAQRANGDLGNGIFRYEGAQGVDNPQLSIWEASLMGGMVMVGDPRAPNEKMSVITMITGPRRILENLESELSGQQSAA